MVTRRAVAFFTLFSIGAAISPARAQTPGQNVNMVAGTTWPGGDPHLQRQNEGSAAVSSRNPLHILAGANDYRTVDLPGLVEEDATGDAWNGLFKSINGGGRWFSTLVPGYPQDQSPEGLASPLKGYQAGADAYVRSSTHGLFYYSGLVFNRGDNQPSAIYVARYIDRNNKENGDPIGYMGTSIVASDTGENFLDKPTIAVGPPVGQFAATCSIDGQVVKSGPLYAVWTLFPGDNHPHNERTDLDPNGDPTPPLAKIIFSKSLDCGVTWTPQYRLETVGTNQGASIAVDPRNGVIYVAWRRFKGHDKPDEIIVTSSTTGGRTWRSKQSLPGFYPFDQGTTGTSFRTNAYPTIGVDHLGQIYIAWTSRGFAPDAPDPVQGDARIVISVGYDHRNYSMPRAIDNFPGRGHQIMPAIATVGGRVQLVYYDFREDVSGFFTRFVDELSVLTSPNLPRRRHTVDVRAAQALVGPAPEFTSYAVNPVEPSARASQYLIGSRPTTPDVIEQLQFNPPNLPIFGGGTLPFIGDYVDIGYRQFVPGRNADGTERWDHNGNDAPIFHLVWADNRDVRPPADGDWTNYTPINLGGQSIYNPGVMIPPCVPGQAGMRNQNLYTSRVTPGLVVGSPGNTKPLSTDLERAFVVYAQNTTDLLALYRFSIRNQPVGGKASFVQSFPNAVPPQNPPAVTQLDVLVQPRSSAARTVFVTSSDPHAVVLVDIFQIAGGGAPPPPPEGQGGTVVLNPDITNPDITNPDITNPDITNPDITNAEAYNPDITNPDITNPDITNPDITNPDITNPDITNIDVANPDITNPDITNPDITNPDITNPDITNPDITNADIDGGEVDDHTYTVENQGNTSSQYYVDLEATDPVPASQKLQFIIHRIYQTPVADGCNLKLQTQNQVILNLPNPLDSTEPISFWLEPGEKIKLTFRVVDTDGPGGDEWDPTESLDITVRAAAVNTLDAAEGSTTPASTSATPPVAVEDAFEFEGGTFDVAAPGVLGNDSFSTVVPVLVTGPQYAQSFELKNDGSFSYVPNGDFPGSDSFTYFLQDGTLHSNTVTVTLTGPAANPLLVTNTDDSGPGSLRNAIEFANNQEGQDTITFNIPGPIGFRGVDEIPLPPPSPFRRIQLSSLLPFVTESTIIDGSSQPGYDGEPIVILDGSGIQLICDQGPNEDQCPDAWGLVLSGGNSTVRGLGIVNIPASGLMLASSENWVRGNWIGFDPQTGQAGPNQGAGVAISGGSDGNLIGKDCGGEAPCDDVDRNVISGNRDAGVWIAGSNNSVRGNYIGTDDEGEEAVGNAEGVSITGGDNNRVGGVWEDQGNVISGNAGAGVAVRSNYEGEPDNVFIQRNIIGLDDDGDEPVGNGTGVLLVDTYGVNVGTNGRGNVISGNWEEGVHITGAAANWNRVRGNLIGVVEGEGFDERPNGWGIVIEGGAHGNYVGGSDSAGDRNIIAGNMFEGIYISDGSGNSVRGNWIGVAGNQVIANGCGAGGSYEGVCQFEHWWETPSSGIYLGAAPETVIGGGSFEHRNVIGGNGEHGILVDEGSEGTLIQGNYVGIDPQNNHLGNSGFGIYLSGADGITIGGFYEGEGNWISNNQGGGIGLFAADNNSIIGNMIGLRADRDGYAGNAGHGVHLLGSSYNTVGGDGSSYANEIAGNNGSGILVEDHTVVDGDFELFIGAVYNVMLGNLIQDNEGLSIDLLPEPGQNDNDEDDVDSGANRLQNGPEITWMGLDGPLFLQGTFDGEPGAGKKLRIEFFLSPGCGDSEGPPDAAIFLKSIEAFTDEAGDVDFWAELPSDLIGFTDGIVATATLNKPDVGANTSEVSRCVTLRDFTF